MADTVDKVREILGYEISLKIFDGVEDFFDFICELSKAGISF